LGIFALRQRAWTQYDAMLPNRAPERPRLTRPPVILCRRRVLPHAEVLPFTTWSECSPVAQLEPRVPPASRRSRPPQAIPFSGGAANSQRRALNVAISPRAARRGKVWSNVLRGISDIPSARPSGNAHAGSAGGSAAEGPETTKTARRHRLRVQNSDSHPTRVSVVGARSDSSPIYLPCKRLLQQPVPPSKTPLPPPPAH
jgi:hypothetical protein